jgi:hypothetical protein
MGAKKSDENLLAKNGVKFEFCLRLREEASRFISFGFIFIEYQIVRIKKPN